MQPSVALEGWPDGLPIEPGVDRDVAQREHHAFLHRLEAADVEIGVRVGDERGEIRLILEERASFSPDALTGLEANLRFVGPETMETRIFGRLTAWQNWIFQRPNAVGEEGALKRYGSGQKPSFDTRRV